MPVRTLILFTLAAIGLLAADTSWNNVQSLPGKSEIRIYQKGAKDPVSAVFADANAERIIVVMKNKQVAIAKDDIDRIDARPVSTGPKKPSVTTTETTHEPDYSPEPPGKTALPSTSSSSSISFGKPEFKTVYRR